MKSSSLRATLLLLPCMAVGTSACTVTVGGDDGGTSAFDVATVDGATPEAASTADGNLPPDTGSTGDAEIKCTAAQGSNACTFCLAASCCREESACASEPTDGGTTECQDIASCYNDCLAPPADSGVAAGTSMECETACFASHSSQAITDFSAVKACATASCGATCP
ncbi:MAG: hypothetical protein M3O50_16170 [Myxococcota bacterium]|nr:hypothetical protein [Myxococcota bacterium]